MKQLRRWIKNKRKEQSSNRQASTTARSSNATAAPASHAQQQPKQQHALPAAGLQGAQQPAQPLKCEDQSPSAADFKGNSMPVVPMPAPVTHCSVPEQPGQAWLNFTLDKQRIVQHLRFPALPQTAH